MRGAPTRSSRAPTRLEADGARALLDQVGLADQAARPAAVLAYGDQKRLELAVALANDPELLLLDEPTAGMAPAERGALMALTSAIARERGLAVLFTEHDMDVVFSVADRIMVLHQGRVIAEGAPVRRPRRRPRPARLPRRGRVRRPPIDAAAVTGQTKRQVAITMAP